MNSLKVLKNRYTFPEAVERAVDFRPPIVHGDRQLFTEYAQAADRYTQISSGLKTVCRNFLDFEITPPPLDAFEAAAAALPYSDTRELMQHRIRQVISVLAVALDIPQLGRVTCGSFDSEMRRSLLSRGGSGQVRVRASRAAMPPGGGEGRVFVWGDGGSPEVGESPAAGRCTDRRCYRARDGIGRGGARGRRQQRDGRPAAGGPVRLAGPGGSRPGVAGRARPAVLAGGAAPRRPVPVPADRARVERLGGRASLPIRSARGGHASSSSTCQSRRWGSAPVARSLRPSRARVTGS